MTKVVTDQACFHQLKVACSKFIHVFAQHPELSNEITICKPVADTFGPSLLLWTQLWSSSICKFNTFSLEQPHKLMLVLGCQ